MVRSGVALAVGVAVGWFAAPGPATITEYRTVTRTETVEVGRADPDPVPTPLADSLVDWDRLEVETECLWEFLQRHGIELTLHNIVTAGDWTDINGGACAVLEREDHAGMEG